MYVTGRGNSGPGTILAACMQALKSNSESQITVFSRTSDSADDVYRKADWLNDQFNSYTKVEYVTLGTNPEETLSSFIRSNVISAAIVSVPDHLHYFFSKISITHQIPTLVVKPLTDNLKDALELAELADQNKTYGAVEFHKRWDESNLYLKKRFKESKYGSPLYFDVNYSQRIHIPINQFSSWVDKTNIFQYLGVHYVDLVHFITDAKPVELTVIGFKKKLLKLGINTYDSIHVNSLWICPNGEEFNANFNISWVDPNTTTAMSDQRILFVGTDGRIECDQKNRGISEVTTEQGPAHVNPYFSEWLTDSDGNPFINGYGIKSITQFLEDTERLQNDPQLLNELNTKRPSFKNSLISMSFIDTVNKNLLKGTKEWTKVNI